MSSSRFAVVLLSLATLCGCQCGPTTELQLKIHVVGQGQVAVGASNCANECELGVQPSTLAVAVAAAGWQFNGWSGICEGTSNCLVDEAGELTATFTEQAVVVLMVAGPGSVLASDGRRCIAGECRWPTTAPIRLTALPQPGAEFVGYSGACVGTACTLSAGQVQATFRPSREVLQVEFVGTGSGVVRDTTGTYACNQSCTLSVPTGLQLDLQAQPDLDSVFSGFSGACSGTTCLVTAPAALQARFDSGRHLVITSLGNGAGTIQVDGVACPTPCDVIVPRERAVTVTATADETSRFRGFTGDCMGDVCTLGAGTADLAVATHFDSVLQWVRSFPIPSGSANNVALFADDAGISVAASVWGSMEVDGVTYAEPYPYRRGSPYFIELGWDAAVQSVFPFYDYVDGGMTRTDVASLTRGPDGTLFAFGVCFQGHFLGQPCGATTVSDGVPFVLELADAGVRGGELRTDLQDSNPVGFLDSHLVGDVVVARLFRHDQFPNGRSGFYLRPHGADAGTISLVPDVLSGGGFFANARRECIVEGESLVCVSPVSGAFTGLGCSSSAPAGSLAAYRYTPSTGRCDLEWRMLSGSFAVVSGVTRSSGRLAFVGGNASGFYDFGSGFSVNGDNFWLGAVEGGAAVVLTPSVVVRPQLAQPVAIVPSTGATASVLVLLKTGPLLSGPAGPLFGLPLTANDSAHVVTFDAAGQLVRKWPLVGGAANPPEIRNGAMVRVGDDIVVAVIGSGYAFRGEALAPDLQMRLFVMVFRE